MESISAYIEIVEALQTRFPEGIKDEGESFGIHVFSVENENIKEVVEFLASDDLGFAFLTDLCGMHYDDTDDLGVVYLMHNLYSNLRVRLKTRFPKTSPDTYSISSIFKSANWQERETYDFFGIIFKGHPNLTRILNVDEMDYFPLRKEYALEDTTRLDKSDDMFGR